jgi:electron transfer flavoprotein alpha subunit
MAILVYTENWDGKFKKLSFELLSYASKLGELTGNSVTALSIGNIPEEDLKLLGDYGADKILKVESDKLTALDNQIYARIIAEAAENESSEVILMANNNQGKALAPRVAVRLKAGLGAALTSLPAGTDPFVVTKKVFSGKAEATVELKSKIKVLTLSQNSYEVVENKKDPSLESFNPSFEVQGTTTRKKIEKQTGKIILTDAEIVVSGGRGMKSPDNWGPIEELAGLLGAATACSRPVSDEGWRPHDEHTGQTGKIIAPNLYFAFGISGAIQHLAGVSASKCIVAVNTDPDAPIFEAADYGIVGDAQKVLPEFISALKQA